MKSSLVQISDDLVVDKNDISTMKEIHCTVEIKMKSDPSITYIISNTTISIIMEKLRK